MIRQRLDALRSWCKRRNIDAFIVPSTDPHASEYPAPHFACREWLTGFTGSAGTAVVVSSGSSGFGSSGGDESTPRAALWTDSRYFLQAERQLTSDVVLVKQGVASAVGIADWLAAVFGEEGRDMLEHTNGAVVGVDGRLFSVDEFHKLSSDLAEYGMQLIVEDDPFDEIWKDRPSLTAADVSSGDDSGTVYVMPIEYAGESAASKIARLQDLSGGMLCVTQLDSIAWMLNMRGCDVQCTPVFMSYLMLDGTQGGAHLFIDATKLPGGGQDADIVSYFNEQGVVVHDYDSWVDFISEADVVGGRRVVVEPSTMDIRSYWALRAAGADVVHGSGAVALAQAVYNQVQIDGFRLAMMHDGVALLRFERWLEEAFGSDFAGISNHPPVVSSISEVDAELKLHELRMQCADCVGDSFPAIVAYGEHGAIVHYSATAESDVAIGRESLFLVDSGGQYRYGTTDVTRTFWFGGTDSSVNPVNDVTSDTLSKGDIQKYRRDYTNVLCGLIDLSMARFPVGTRGAQLDALARTYLWRDGVNYLHGTGHGVGHFLSVHQGPQSVRMNENPIALQRGMVQSVEPGVYRAAQWGVRLENLTLVVPAADDNGCSDGCGDGNNGDFNEFETLTMYPFERSLIDTDRLNDRQREWLDAYHARVYTCLTSQGVLTNDEIQYLAQKTKPLNGN